MFGLECLKRGPRGRNFFGGQDVEWGEPSFSVVPINFGAGQCESHTPIMPDWPGVTFFESLTKPAWIPPDWAFPAAWFTLWALQAAALLVLVASDRPGRNLALGLLVAQFATAVAWQAVVFGPGRLGLAAWWLLGVLLLVVAATVAAWRVSALAGAFVAPTIVWCAVATTLGFSLLRLNPGA